MKKELITPKNTTEITPETRLKRLRYRSWHRGCKETDLILGWFADENLEKMTANQLDIYEQFLDENDVNIWDWLVGKSPIANPDYIPIVAALKPYGQKVNV